MFEGQFYIRLVLTVIVGIMFVYALCKMAKHNNQETMPLPHKAMHIVGWIFIGLSALCLCICVYYLTLIDFPQQLIGPFTGPNTIIRSTSAVFYWGYPTLIQNSALTMALATFDLLGIGAYFRYFKSSHSKWWKKVLKFFVVLLLYAFMASATNFHYFDFPEFVAPILFFILWMVIINRKDKPIQSDRSEIEFDKEEKRDVLEKSFSDSSKDDSVVFLSSEDASNENQSTVVDKATPCTSLGEEKVDTILTQPDMQFCRHCGKKIEADSSFCKYCGGRMGDSKSGKIYYIIHSIKNTIKYMIIKMEHMQHSLFKTKTSCEKIKRTLKWIAISLVSLVVLIGIGSAIWYYIDVVLPEQKAIEILESEKNDLNSTSGTTLYLKCENIIRNHIIPESGDDWRDSQNLRELTDYAWHKITLLAERGHAEAQFMLGVKYNGYDFWDRKWRNEEEQNSSSRLRMLGSPFNYDKAAYWYLKAAEQNHSGAQNNLGNCYMYGRGVGKNIKEAIKWYRLSASNDDDYGQLSLGDCFRDGHKIQIGEHWEKDVDAGYYSWAYKIGYHTVPDYEILIQQNIDSAKYYWEKSALQGNETAKERLQKIY